MNKKLKFHYLYDENYSPEYISGIASNVSPEEKLELNFYIERTALPRVEVYDINKDGHLSELKEERTPKTAEGEIRLVRHIKSGIMLDLDGAEMLKGVLEEYIDLMGKDDKEEK